jgi:hypothetical protein
VWLPAEVLHIQNQTPVVGYVVAIEDDWTTILLEDGRTVEEIRSGDLLGREVCNLTPHSGRPLAQVIAGEHPTGDPQCNDLLPETTPSVGD